MNREIGEKDHANEEGFCCRARRHVPGWVRCSSGKRGRAAARPSRLLRARFRTDLQRTRPRRMDRRETPVLRGERGARVQGGTEELRQPLLPQALRELHGALLVQASPQRQQRLRRPRRKGMRGWRRAHRRQQGDDRRRVQRDGDSGPRRHGRQEAASEGMAVPRLDLRRCRRAEGRAPSRRRVERRGGDG